MRIQHRFVDFSTSFTPAPGRRGAGAAAPSLHENEIAVDVGSACFGCPGEARWIFDHHFPKAGCPCAAVAVLCHAGEIKRRFAGESEVWIVTHADPDFDALCASYLVRALLTGALDPAALETLGVPDLDWFDPAITLDHPLAWAILLAAYAARLDQARHTPVEPSRRLHAVLYAAKKRKRDYAADGLQVFFDTARRVIAEKKRNPLFDALFDDEPEFAPELQFLDREQDAYRRDRTRARKSLVRLPVTADFDRYHARVSAMPLLAAHEGGELFVTGDQLAAMAAGDKLEIFDAIWIEDPESLLFKEWARDDFAGSSLGRGFTFTAVRYRDAVLEWFFSLDPERCGGAHLYPLWAKLQRQEAEARRRLGLPDSAPQPVRSGYETRARGAEAAFRDPWFDGVSFRGTIVVSPTGGSAVNEETLPQLTADPALGKPRLPMRAAQSLLEDSVFMPFDDLVEPSLPASGSPGKPVIRVWQYPIPEPASRQPLGEVEPVEYHFLDQALDIEPLPRHYLFAEVRLDLPELSLRRPSEGLGWGSRQFATQIGHKIWPILEDKGVDTVPADFEERHLLISPYRVAVWSRRGVVIASISEDGVASREVEAFRGHMEEIQKIARDLGALLEVVGDPRRPITPRENGKVRELVRRVARIQQAASLPENLSLRRFVEGVGFEKILDPLDRVTGAIRQEDQNLSDRKLQRVLGFAGTGLALLGIPPVFQALAQMKEKGISIYLPVGAMAAVGLLAVALIYLVTRKK